MKYSRRSSVVGSSAGFTIVELMIATTVFSVVLLLCTYGLVSIGRTYYKGVTTSRAQTTARSISDNIARSVQYGGKISGSLTGSSGQICIGKARYTYVAPTAPNYDNSSLKYDEPANCAAPLSATYRELLPKGLRMSSLKVYQAPPVTATTPYTITVRVTSGDHDLFSGPNGSIDGSCKGGAGLQFCAVSNIETQASPRI